MSQQEVKIEGVLVLDQPAEIEGAHIAVELRDTGMADVPRKLIGQMRGRISGAGIQSIPFHIDARVEPGRSYTLAAEVRRGPALAPGDLLNVASHPWRAGDVNPVMIELKPIS